MRKGRPAGCLPALEEQNGPPPGLQQRKQKQTPAQARQMVAGETSSQETLWKEREGPVQTGRRDWRGGKPGGAGSGNLSLTRMLLREEEGTVFASTGIAGMCPDFRRLTQ